MISIDDFKKIELKAGTILSAERVEGSEKLIALTVDLGATDNTDDENGLHGRDVRQIVAGIGNAYEPEVLVGKNIVVVANLEPRSLMGMESQGMLLAAEGESGPVLLMPEKEVVPGTKVR